MSCAIFIVFCLVVTFGRHELTDLMRWAIRRFLS
jgi:hypothetical protein